MILFVETKIIVYKDMAFRVEKCIEVSRTLDILLATLFPMIILQSIVSGPAV